MTTRDTKRNNNAAFVNVKRYEIDWDKVQTLDDIKLILAPLEITYGPEFPYLDKMKHILKDQTPGSSTQPPQEETNDGKET